MNKTQNIIPIQSDLQIITNVQRMPEFIQFIHWFATPKKFRNPKSQKDFAKQIEVCEDTITNWKNHDAFIPLLQKAIKKWMVDHAPDVIGGLYVKACSKGHAKDVEMFLKISGMDKIN